MFLFALIGCVAARPDVAGDAGRALGLENAIVFRTRVEAIDVGPSGGADLSPQQALRLALEHDPRIQAALAKVRVAEADANQARLLPNPILNVDFRFPQPGQSNRVFEATLTGDLVGLLQKPGQIGAADKRLRESASDALSTVLDVASEVQIAYSTARSIDAEMENARGRLKILEQLRDMAQKRLDAGDATRLDVLTLEAQRMQATLDLSDLQLQLVEQRLTLARLLGQPRSAADWKLSPWEAPADTALASEAAWIDAALANRPELRSRMWELKALGDDLAVASLSPLMGGDVGAHGERDPEWRVGPTITTPVPIFDFGQAAREKVKAERVVARQELLEAQREAIEDVRLAYATCVQSTQALGDAQDRLLPLQEQQRNQAKLAYESGDADLTTLLLAETDFQLTTSKIAALREKVTVARVRLQRAAGGAGVADKIHDAATMPAAVPTSQPAAGVTK